MTKFSGFFKSVMQSQHFPLLLALLSGVLVGTSYIPFPSWALLFCYVPLWMAVYLKATSPAPEQPVSWRMTFWKSFKLGWITQFVLTLIGFNWIYYVATEFGNLHFTLALAALLLFAAFMHIYVAVAVGLVAVIAQKRLLSPFKFFLSIALIHGLLERIWPSIFEWNLGYTLLWMKWPLFQWADIIGFWGLSTVILIFNAGIATALLSFRKEIEKSLMGVGVVLIIFIVLSTAGRFRGQVIQKEWFAAENIETVQFGLVQGNVGNADKIQSEKGAYYQSHILDLYAGLSQKLLTDFNQSEIILWPETALPFPMDQAFHSRREQSRLLDYASQWNRTIITGGYSVDLDQRDHLGNPLISNSVFFVGPNRNLVAETYNKTDLLVFGEYMPFGEQLPILYQWLPFVGIYKKGPGPTVYEIPLKDKKIHLGPQICYESLNPGFSRGLNQKKAQVVFNVTNDSWFGWWAEPYQHQIMTLARGVEIRTPLVRSTNTGITSAILADGRLLMNSPINETWVHNYEIPYLKEPRLTIYTKYGHFDWLFWSIVLLGILLTTAARKNNVSN